MSPPTYSPQDSLQPLWFILLMLGILLVGVFALIRSCEQMDDCSKSKCPEGKIPVMAQQGKCICATPAKGR